MMTKFKPGFRARGLGQLVAVAVLAMAGTVALADYASAKPPCWAPAHGARRQGKVPNVPCRRSESVIRIPSVTLPSRTTVIERSATTVVREVDLTTIIILPQTVLLRPTSVLMGTPVYLTGTTCRRQDVASDLVGGILGGIAGGLLGSKLGDDNTAATIAGSVIGTLLGEKIASNMAPADQVCALEVIEAAQTGQIYRWTNPTSGMEYVFTMIRWFNRDDGLPCRQFSTSSLLGDAVDTVAGTACRNEEGLWSLVEG